MLELSLTRTPSAFLIGVAVVAVVAASLCGLALGLVCPL
jgi:hypothetical protein